MLTAVQDRGLQSGEVLADAIITFIEVQRTQL